VEGVREGGLDNIEDYVGECMPVTTTPSWLAARWQKGAWGWGELHNTKVWEWGELQNTKESSPGALPGRLWLEWY
jgi:hypothetical protein